MRIFDAFIFFNEIDVLKMRLDLHGPYVDRFYICESDHTHRGHPKEYFLDDHLNELSPWIDKIVFIRHKADMSKLNPDHVDAHMNLSSPAWVAEMSQRDALKACSVDSSPGDFIAISDVDEFISPHIFSMIRDCPEARNFDVARVEMINHYYFMNCQATGQNKHWFLPMIFRADKFAEINDLGNMRPNAHIPLTFPGGGWHFSYLGGTEQIIKKISAFAHSEVDRPDIKNAEHIAACAKNGVDYIGRQGHEYAFMPVSSYPECIQSLMKKNRNFVRWSLE